MIAITGASGQLGRLVAEGLLNEVENPQDVVLTLRNPDKVKDLAARGALVRAADFNDPISLPQAYDGVETLLIISGDAPVEPRTIQHRNAVAAAKASGVRRVVYTSFTDAQADSPFSFSAIHADTEAALKDSGLSYSILRNNSYMDMILMSLPVAQEMGVFAQPSGQGKVALVSRRDLARATVQVLRQETLENHVYHLDGPALLTGQDIADHLSEALGKPIRFIDMPRADYEELLADKGLPAFMAEALGGLFEAVKAGRLASQSEDLEQLLSEKPMTLERFLADSLAA
ncbi:SDR family oxidoreductase [Rhodovibrionaceae bacterium A322]